MVAFVKIAVGMKSSAGCVRWCSCSCCLSYRRGRAEFSFARCYDRNEWQRGRKTSAEPLTSTHVKGKKKRPFWVKIPRVRVGVVRMRIFVGRSYVGVLSGVICSPVGAS